MKKTFLDFGLILVTSLTLVACNKDSGGSSAKVRSGPPKESPSGVFASSGTLANDKSILTYCDSNTTKQLDSRIQPGSTQSIEWSTMTTTGTYENSPREDHKVLAASSKPDSIELQLRVETTVNGVAGWYENTCSYKFDNSGNSSSCEMTAVSDSFKPFNNEESANGPSASCSTEVIPVETREEGTYRFMDGSSVPAIRVETRSKGTLKCFTGKDGEMTPRGLGETVIVQILTPAIADFNQPFTCGNLNQIYRFEKALLDDGTTLALSKNEILSTSN